MNSYKVNFETVAQIPFSAVFDYLGVPYTKNGNKLMGTGFAVTIDKNLYWASGNDHGNVINYTARHRNCSLYDAAKELYDHFLAETQQQAPTGSNNESDGILPDTHIAGEPERANEDRQVHPDKWWFFDLNGKKIGYLMQGIQ